MNKKHKTIIINNQEITLSPLILFYLRNPSPYENTYFSFNNTRYIIFDKPPILFLPDSVNPSNVKIISDETTIFLDNETPYVLETIDEESVKVISLDSIIKKDGVYKIEIQKGRVLKTTNFVFLSHFLLETSPRYLINSLSVEVKMMLDSRLRIIPFLKTFVVDNHKTSLEIADQITIPVHLFNDEFILQIGYDALRYRYHEDEQWRILFPTSLSELKTSREIQVKIGHGGSIIRKVLVYLKNKPYPIEIEDGYNLEGDYETFYFNDIDITQIEKIDIISVNQEFSFFDITKSN